MANSENLDICPFCKNTIPQGPAYFCPTCGKKLGHEYSKRYFSFDEFPNEIQSALTGTGIIEEKTSDDEEISDYTEFFNNVSKSLSFEEEYENFDEDLSSIDDIVSEVEEETILDDDLPINNDFIYEDKNDESELEIKNKSIKLDVWLRNCFDDSFLENFLRYKSFKDFTDKEDQISKIISNFELEDILLYKYKKNFESFFDSLNEILIGCSVLDLVNIAKDYDVEIALSKKNLLLNFLDKYSPYELLAILEENDIDYQKVLRISVLEQVYVSSDYKLDELSKVICPNVEDSRYSKISCILNNFEEGFLISNNNLDRGVEL